MEKKEKSGIREISDAEMKDVSGGIYVDGKQYVKVDMNKVLGNEYRCTQCGYVGYINEKTGNAVTRSCPRCKASKYKTTGRFYIPYNELHNSGQDAYWNRD